MVDTVVHDSAPGNELPCLADDFPTPKVNQTESQRNTETIVETSAKGTTPAAPLVAAGVVPFAEVSTMVSVFLWLSVWFTFGVGKSSARQGNSFPGAES